MKDLNSKKQGEKAVCRIGHPPVNTPLLASFAAENAATAEARTIRFARNKKTRSWMSGILHFSFPILKFSGFVKQDFLLVIRAIARAESQALESNYF